MNEAFVDSNIILYLMDDDDRKKSIASQILSERPFINSQVLAEVANVCRRRFKYTKNDISNLWTDLFADCRFTEITKTTFHKAIELVKTFDLQIFDSLIVASALEAGCNILYSEDMHHSMIVESKLTIINPFL